MKRSHQAVMFPGWRWRPTVGAAVLLLLLGSWTSALGAPQQEVFLVRSGPSPSEFLQPSRGLAQVGRRSSSIRGLERQNAASPIPVSQELLWLLQQIPARQKSFLPPPSSDRRFLAPAASSANGNILDASLGRFSGSRDSDRGNFDEITSQGNIPDTSFGRLAGSRTNNQNNRDDFVSRRLFVSAAPNPDAAVSPRLEAIQNIAQSPNFATSSAVSSPFQLVGSQPSTQDLLQIRALQLQQLEQQQRLIELQNELLEYQRLLRQQPEISQVNFGEQRIDGSDRFPVTAVNSFPSNRQQLLIPSPSNSSPRLETEAKLLTSNPPQPPANDIKKDATPVSQVVHTVTQTVFVPISTSDAVDERREDAATQEESNRAIPIQEAELNAEDQGSHLNALKSTDRENLRSDSHTPGTDDPTRTDTQGEDHVRQNGGVEDNAGIVGEDPQDHELSEGETIPLDSEAELDRQIQTQEEPADIPEKKASDLEGNDFDIDHDVHSRGSADISTMPEVGAETGALISETSLPSTSTTSESVSKSENDPNMAFDVFIDALPRNAQVDVIEKSSTSSSTPVTPEPPSDPTAEAKDAILLREQKDDANEDEIHFKTPREQNQFEGISTSDGAEDTNSVILVQDEILGENIGKQENLTSTADTQILEGTQIKDLDSAFTLELFEHSEGTTQKFFPHSQIPDSLSPSPTFPENVTPDEEVSIVEDPSTLESGNDFSQNSHHDALLSPPKAQSDVLVTEELDILANTKHDSPQDSEQHSLVSSLPTSVEFPKARADVLIIRDTNAPENVNEEFSPDSQHDAPSSTLNTESPDALPETLIVRESNLPANADTDFFQNSPDFRHAPLQTTHDVEPSDSAADVFIVTDSDIHENTENNFDVKARVLSEPVNHIPLSEKNDDRQDVKTTLSPLVVESTSTLRIFQNNAEIITNSPPQSETLINTVTPPSDEHTTNMLPIEAMFENFDVDHPLETQSQDIQEDAGFSDTHNHSVNATGSGDLDAAFPENDTFLEEDSVKPSTSIDDDSQHVLSSPGNEDLEVNDEIAGGLQLESFSSKMSLQSESDVPSSNGTILVTRGPLEIDFDAPRIVERTVVSISSNIEANSPQQTVSDGLETKSFSGNADGLAESHNVPTFTVFVNPKTGRIFKRSVPSIPEDMSSKLSEILKMKEKQMENANKRFRGRQGLFTLFRSEQNSEKSESPSAGKSVSVKNSEPVDERPRPVLADRLTARKVNPNAGPSSDRRKILSSLRAQRMKKLQAFTATSSFSNRLGEAAPAPTNDEDVTEATLDSEASGTVEDSSVPTTVDANESTNPDVAQVPESEANPAEEPAKEDADKQLTLQEQLKKLLRNKNTGDKVRRRLLSSRRSFLQKKRAQNTVGDDAEESPKSISSTTTEPPTTTARPLRFNRFRNQASTRNRGTDRRDRVRSLASRFRNRNQENKPDDTVAEEKEKVDADVKPSAPPSKPLSKPPSTPPSKPPSNRRFKLTRFEGLRRRERPAGRRPFNRPAATTTEKPPLSSSSSSTPKDDSNDITSSTTPKPIRVGDLTTRPSIVSDVEDNLIIEDLDTTEAPAAKPSDLPPFMAKFKEIISKTTPSPELGVISSTPIAPSNNEIFTPTLNEIGDESTQDTSVKSTTVSLEPMRPSPLPVLTDDVSFEVSTQPIQTTPFTDSPLVDLTTTESLLDTTEIFANLENTLPPIITITSAPVPIIRSDEDAVEKKTIQSHSPTSFLDNVIRSRKFPASVEEPAVKVQGEKVSDVFSRMLASIAEQKRKNIVRSEHDAKTGVTKTQPKEDESAFGSQFLGVGRKSVFSKSHFDADHNVVPGVPIQAVVASLSSRTQGFRPRINRLPVNLKPDTTTASTIIQDRENIPGTTQKAENTFVVASSATIDPKVLTSTPVSPVDDAVTTTTVAHFPTTSPPALRSNSLKARLMKGNFSLLVDGVLLEEVASASQNDSTDFPQLAENINLRLFDIPVIMNFSNITFPIEKPEAISPVSVPSSTSTEFPLEEEVFSNVDINNATFADDNALIPSVAHVPFLFIEETVNADNRPEASGRSLQFDSVASNNLPAPVSAPEIIQTEIESAGKPLEGLETPADENVQTEDLDLLAPEALPTTSHTPLFHEIFPSLFGANSEQKKDSSDSATQLNDQFNSTNFEPRMKLIEELNESEFSFLATDKPEVNEMDFMSPHGEIEFEGSQAHLLKPVPLIPFDDDEHLDNSNQFLNGEPNIPQTDPGLSVKGVDDVISEIPFGGTVPSDDDLSNINTPSITFDSMLSHTTQRAIPSSDFNTEDKLLSHQDLGLNIESPNNFFQVEQTTQENRGMIPERIDPRGSPILPEVADEFQDSFSPVIHSQLDRAFMPVVTDQPNNFIPSINIHAKNKVFAPTDTTVNDIDADGRSFFEDFTTEMPFSFTEPSVNADEVSVKFENVVPDSSLQPDSQAAEFNSNLQPSLSFQTDSDPGLGSDDSHLLSKENDHSILTDFINQLNPTTTSPFDIFNTEMQTVDIESPAHAENTNEFNPGVFNESILSSSSGGLFTTEANNFIFSSITPEPSSVSSEPTTPRSTFTEGFDTADAHAFEFAGVLENSFSVTTPQEGLVSDVREGGFNKAQSPFGSTDLLGSPIFSDEEQNPTVDVSTKIVEPPVQIEPQSIAEELPQISALSPQILRTSLRDRRPAATPQRTSGSLFPRPIPVEQPSLGTPDDTDMATHGGSGLPGSQSGDSFIAKKKVIRITSLTLLTPSPPMNMHAAPSPRQLVPIPLQGESSLSSRRRRPGVRTRTGNARRLGFRNRTDVKLPTPQLGIGDDIRGMKSSTLNSVRRPESKMVGKVVNIERSQPTDFASDILNGQNRAETRAFTNQPVSVSSASDSHAPENQISSRAGAPEFTVTASRSPVRDEENSFSRTDEASEAQITSVDTDDDVPSTTAPPPAPDNTDMQTKPPLVPDLLPESVEAAHELIHDTFNLQSKISGNDVVPQEFETSIASTLTPLPDLNIDTSVISDQEQEHASKNIPSHTDEIPLISTTDESPRQDELSHSDKRIFSSPTDESTRQDVQHVDSSFIRPMITSELTATGQGKISDDLTVNLPATLLEPRPREEGNLPDSFIPFIVSSTQGDGNENNEFSTPKAQDSKIGNIPSTSMIPPIQTSTVPTDFQNPSVPDTPVAKQDLSSMSENAELSANSNSISSSSILSASPESALPVLPVPSSDLADNLHNLTNDELLLLDLLADIVETPATIPINPETETLSHDFFSHSGNTATEEREPKSIDTSEGEFAFQNLQFSENESSKNNHKEQNFRDTPSSFQSISHRGRPVFPPPLPQFPQMPTITTPKPFTNHFQFSNTHQENESENRFGFSGNFPFHVFDSLTVNQPIRPRSVSSSSAPVNTVSPNFSFFQVFNPPQAASRRSQTVAPFPFLGKSVVQRKPSVAFRESVPHSIMNRPQDGNSRGSSHPHANSQPFTTNDNHKSKIVSMRTESGSLIFLPSEKVHQAMKIGMGTPLNISEMQKKSRRS